MKQTTRSFLILLLTLAFTAIMFSSCSHEEVPSEDLFFQALELASSGSIKEAASAYATCVERRDAWAAIASEQLLDLLTLHPYADLSKNLNEAISIAYEYHPPKQSSLRIKKDYDTSYSAESLAGFSASILDEIASSWLSSSEDKRKCADLFAEALSLKREKPLSSDDETALWLLAFYAARLYEKNGSSTWQTALAFYDEARICSYSDLTYDRSLWYYLELSRRSDYSRTARMVSRYSNSWHDDAYFDDLYERLAADLLSHYAWNAFQQVYSENNAFMSPAIKAKYAYLLARLTDIGFCNADNSDNYSRNLYQTVFDNAEHGSYYDIVAHYITEVPFTLDGTDETEGDAFTEHLLGKLAEYDYPDLTYRYLKEYCSQLSTPVLAATYSYLLSKPDSRQLFLPLTSLALKTAHSRQTDRQLLSLAFPPYYRTLVEFESRKNGLEPWLLFALIHSESCFQADITSAAGAHGLTQLMESTAGDIARKLKIKEFDLDDADTNVQFGSFYLSELIGRLDGNVLLAAFSYNAGITRVRNWKKQASRLPPDIFLETLPYEETRTYGQKILRAAVMYGMLYYDEYFPNIVQSIMDFSY